MSENEFFEFYISKFREVYIGVYGADKWNSLTDKEKHDAIMMSARDLRKVMSEMGKGE